MGGGLVGWLNNFKKGASHIKNIVLNIYELDMKL